ncbi:hypothetical protein [Mycobacterium interjectum]|nr:hypothetical protein [Mycobacterium interjectum]MCV7088773.1 hypothetical protein [Mycobacterium interjectum]
MSAPPAAKTNLWPVAILGAAVVIAVIVAVVLVAALRNTNTTNSATAAQTNPSTYPAGAPEPASTSAPPVDPEAAAYQQLVDLKNQDASAIDQVSGSWIPQLSSKHGTQPWTYDSEDGMTYDSVLTLQEHQRLRQQYGAKLVWSGDWTTWDHPDYWVTVVPQGYSTVGGALSWCGGHGLDKDHCSAQIVSKTLSPNGTHG